MNAHFSAIAESHPAQHDVRPPVAVVGGGITGLTAAWSLRRAGRPAVVIEAAEALGGRSSSALLGERSVTLGGKNIGRRYATFRAFVADHGPFDYEYFGINSSRVRDGEILTLDRSKGLRGVGHFFRDAPPRDLARFAALALLVRARERHRFLGSRLFERLGARGEPTLADVFGPRFCDMVVRPMTVRMNGAEPDETYLSNFGTNLGTLLDSYDQLSQGLGTLFAAVERRQLTQLGTRVTGVVVRDGRVTGLRLHAGGRSWEQDHDEVLLAIPAPAAAALLVDVDEQLASVLRRVRYQAAAVVLAEYAQDVFGHDVRALLFGPDEPLSNAGAYAVEERNVVRYTLSGRTARALLERTDDPEQLATECEHRLARHLPVRAADRRALLTRRWEHAYCAYAPAHTDLLRDIRRRTARISGLHLTGDWVQGVSLEACARAGVAAAAGIEASSVLR